MNLKNKKVLIVGFGITGEAVCRFLLGQAAKIKVSEERDAAALGKDLQLWINRGVEFETGGHTAASFTAADIIILSPGIPDRPEIKKARDLNIPIMSEIELAFRFLKGKIIGITGSNGKSTVATLTQKILEEGGQKSHLAGNIGTPLISYVPDSIEENVYVTELSSFQLAYTEKFTPEISVFLNISSDHLDWHNNFEHYFSSKKRIFSGENLVQTAILNRDDPQVWGLKNTGPFQVYGFSRKEELVRGCFIRGVDIILSDLEEIKLMPVAEIPLPGIHNQENIMAAAIIGHIKGIPPERIRSSILSFEGLEHRLEKVTNINGIDFYNDSKATNVDATLKSIQSFNTKITLILGGRDKGGNFLLLRDEVKARVKRIILIGEAKDKIKDALKDTASVEIAETMQEAVTRGYAAANQGEVVLLAPACTSFDMYQSYAHRGEVFKQEVLYLQDKIKTESR